MIDVRFFAPPADLAPCFDILSARGDRPAGDHLEDWLQPEWATFGSSPTIRRLLNCPTARASRARVSEATGPSSCPIHFELGRTRMWGIGLFPLGWARFIGEDASDHANTLVDGEASPALRTLSRPCATCCVRAIIRTGNNSMR